MKSNLSTPRAMQIRLEYVGVNGAPPCNMTGTKHTWRVWREPRVCGFHWSSEKRRNVRTANAEWAFEDETGYVRYIGETWAVAVEKLKAYVQSYGMKALQDLS